MAQSLHGGDTNNIEARQQEGQADQSQGRDTDLQHLFRCIEDAQKLRSQRPERDGTGSHHSHRIFCRQFHGSHQAVRLSCAIVETDDGNHTVIQTEYRHEDEALQFEVYTEYRCCCGSKGDEDLIHTEGHDRTDGCHTDGRHANGINGFHCMGLQMIFLRIDNDIVIFLLIEPACQTGRTDLTEYCGNGSTLDTHGRHTKQTKDQDRVHDDIDDGTKPLGQHGIEGSARCLQDTFKAELQENSSREQTADTQVICTQTHDLGVIGLQFEKDLTTEQTKNRKNNAAEHIQDQAVIGHQVGTFLVLFPQRTGDQSIDTNAGTGTHRDHQVLGRECQRNRSQRTFAQPCYEHTVNDIIQCLHQHRGHHGQGHTDQKFIDGHNAHFILFHLPNPFFYIKNRLEN